MATADEHRTIAPIVGPDDPRRFTDSGIEVKPLLRRGRSPGRSWRSASASRAQYPYTRGIHRDMYRGQLWTMRQYAGYASAKESNERYRYLLAKGSTGLSMAFDLPTQLGLDSDDPRCLGEVGRTGVAIDTIDDMRTAFDRIPLDQVSTSMTINAPAGVLLLLYELVGEEQGVPVRAAARHHPERHPQGVHRPRQLHLSARGRDPADHRPVRLLQRARPEAGTRSRSAATTSARRAARRCRRSPSRSPTGSPTCRPRWTRGSRSTISHPGWRSSSTATTTSSRRWPSSAPRGGCGPQIMRERFGAEDERSWRLRFHTQTGGVTLTAQQPENNIVRVALQGFAAVVRRHPVAAHQRLRRGARAAHRARGQDRAAHPAGHRLRVGRGRHRRPVRRLVLRRVADRRDRDAAPGS